MSRTAKQKTQKTNQSKNTAGNTAKSAFLGTVSGLATIILSCIILSLILTKTSDPDAFIKPASVICMFLSGVVCAKFSGRSAQNPVACAILSDIVILILLCFFSVFFKNTEIETTPVFGTINIASLVGPGIFFSRRKKKETKRGGKHKKMPA